MLTRIDTDTGKRTACLIPALSERLQLRCVFEVQSPTTFGVLATCSRPRSRGASSHAIRARIGAWWPSLAPSLALVTARRPDGAALGWEEFATYYWAELQAKSKATYLGALIQLGTWLQRFPTVTLLSLERARPNEALGCTQRRVLLAWLLGAATWR